MANPESESQSTESADSLRARPTRFRTCANLSLVLAATAFAIAVIFRLVFTSLAESIGDKDHIIYTGTATFVCNVLLLGGLTCGLVALAGILRHGSDGLLAKGICGVSFNFLLLSFFMPDAFPDFMIGSDERRRTYLREAAEAKASEDLPKLEQFKTAYEARMQAAFKPYAASSEDMQTLEPLNAATIGSLDDLEQRKTAVRKWMLENQVLKKFLATGDVVILEELNDAAVTGLPRKTVLDTFLPLHERTLPFMIAIRDYENQRGEIMLDVLTLWQDEWGSWNYDPSADDIVFDSEHHRVEYETLLTEYDRIIELQSAAVKQAEDIREGILRK